MQLQDGTGRGFAARVDDSNRLVTLSETITVREVGVIKGDAAYFFTIGLANLTSANESALLYIKNTKTDSVFLMEKIYVSMGNAVGSPGGDVLFKVYPNPTSGSLLTAGAPIIGSNANFGSSVPAQAVALAGAEGKTIASDDPAILLVLHDRFYRTIEFSGALPNGNAMGISIQPPFGNVLMNVSLIVSGYYTDAL